MPNKILILFAHPNYSQSKINRALIDSISDLDFVDLRHIDTLYPDFNIDVKKEQAALLEYSTIVWQHPFYWYSAPALLKHWIDCVLERGFAYGDGGNALSNKQVFNAITTGADKNAYKNSGRNNYTIAEFLQPFEQTAKLCQMKYRTPFAVHNAPNLSDAEIEEQAKNYRELLIETQHH